MIEEIRGVSVVKIPMFSLCQDHQVVCRDKIYCVVRETWPPLSMKAKATLLAKSSL